MSSMPDRPATLWRATPVFWALMRIALFLSVLVYFEGIQRMVHRWTVSEEYGYGFLIPPLVLFLIWQKKDKLSQMKFEGSWAGVALVAASLMLFLLGHLATLYVVMQYALVFTLYGLVLSLTGWRVVKELWAPLLLLLFMIPLPNFLFQNLSAELQLISSRLGVAVIRMLGISVYLEGNVIDLGTYKLQVVEACSGLRYLFPLMTLSFISVYFFKAAAWKRAVVFLSSIPITVLMNSFRIGVIGILVEFWGKEQAEGFLHDFEGWVVFMACIVLLLVEMRLLTLFGKDKRPFSEVFGIDFPEEPPEDVEPRRRTVPSPLVVSISLLVVALASVNALGQRDEIEPSRADFAEFPLHLGSWKGRVDRLDRVYLDALKLDDYTIINYSDGGRWPISFYTAYYASQKTGESAHSPRSCIPGGGWLIKDHKVVRLPGIRAGKDVLEVNRLLIRKGDYVQLVYYWFQQRGRIITNEYLVKWYLFWDALTRNRTDGALVRLTVLLKPDESIDEAEDKMKSLLNVLVPALDAYIPN
ncbi:MAG TPA: VPLPA-CTERM-specific exosortase XrtD [Thiolapillus brandeum]|uniref:VPLPA-CTERM-specific exosortase XrtD n=1 Tax=Thiolapillus brandeum TaxID=1076588 RepID=A0A831RSN8_9GAMM|nr:VPLPA-CTERM-specific exosortase XrtD [Thiolapillus brandeum]